MEDLKKIEKKLGVEFEDDLLLKEALTHRSFLNEEPNWPVDHNERLEFLGDAVLEIVVTKFLFEKYPNSDEGRLTSIRSALVNHKMLFRVANELGLGDFVFMSRGEREGSEKAREAIIANAVEALIGAIYLDKGSEAAEEFVKDNILIHLDDVMERELYADPKSTLQEIAQEKLSITPHYEVITESGPDHKKKFVVGVYMEDEIYAKGEGSSKQEAEREAAKRALEKLE